MKGKKNNPTNNNTNKNNNQVYFGTDILHIGECALTVEEKKYL